MSKDLQITETDQLTPEEQLEIATNIDRLIEANKNNRQAINRLVFESVAAMTEADDAATILARKGVLRRWIGGITGTNQKLQNTINKSRSVAQNVAWLTIQKLAEQNLMTFDLITVVNNKLNASLTKIDNEFSAIYVELGRLFRYNREELTKIENRLVKVEQKVELLQWKNTIRHQAFNGIEYNSLDETAKIVCLTSDFFEITKGNWNTSDLLLLKSTMDEIGISPTKLINYFDTIKAIFYHKELKEKYLGEDKIPVIDEPGCYITMSALIKLETFHTDEKYLIDTIANGYKKNGMKADVNEITNSLVNAYLKKEARVDVDMDVESYDFIIDLLYNLKTVEEVTEEILLIPENSKAKAPVNESTITPNNNDFKKKEESRYDTLDQKEEAVVEKTDEYINNILQISVNENKQFKNKNLHFNNYVNCEGTLVFDHCTIYYNEEDAGGKITLAEGATLKISNSEVVCKGFAAKPFISNDDYSREKKRIIVIEATKFFDCSYFIKGHIDSFTINNCVLFNCYVGFVEINNCNNNSTYKITENVLKENLLSKFNKESDEKYGSLIRINTNGKGSVIFKNNNIIECAGFNVDGKLSLSYVDCRDSLNVTNCYFEGLTHSIDAREIKNCHFKGCKACIKQDSSSKGLFIENCLFENSTNIIETHVKGVIRYCQFVSCYNKLLKTNYLGGLTIEFCEFYNTKCFEDVLGQACIEFQRDSESKTNSNYLKKCTFNGVEIRCGNYTNYLIKPVGYEKPHGTVAYIEDCIFKNCYTDNSSKTIIKEWLQYDSFFMNHDYHANLVRNCQGLDRVNAEGKEAGNFEKRDVLKSNL